MKQISNSIYKVINSYFMSFLTVAIILSLMLIGSVSWNVWKMYQDFTNVIGTEFALENLTGKIIYFDEALTMSARMAACTGDLYWEKRYLKFQPQLDNNIKKLISITPEIYEAHALETNAANLELIKIERQAFDLVHQDKKDEAFELLLNQEYQFDKTIYAKGINKMVAYLQTRIKDNIDSYRHNLFISALFSVITFPLLLFILVGILGVVNYYILDKEKNRLILQSVNSQLEQSNQSLEHKVKERTVKLEQAVHKAKAANQSKEIFLANITHELRSPLNSILGYTKILQNNPNLNSSQLKYLNIVWLSGYHLLTLINDILDFSKFNAHKLKLQPQSLHLKTFLEQIIALIEVSVIEKGLLLNLETSNNLPAYIQADPQRLRQVLINLLSNAVKFTPSGKITLKLIILDLQEIAPAEFSSVQLRFEVADTGIGIDSDRLEQIFLPFVQTGNLESKALGTGLGLSIAQKLVALMGSQLQVKSQLGLGSNFWFDVKFPIVPITENLERDRILGYHGQRRRLLIVDDNSDNCQLLSAMLESLGFEIQVAHNGQEMLSIAHDFQPDLILLDLYMPVQTGFTASKQLRQISSFQDIPIFVITAASISEEMRNYLNCQAFFNKPIHEQDLLLHLQKYLNLQWIYAHNS